MQPANKNQLLLGLGLVGVVVVGILIARQLSTQPQDNRGTASVEGGLAQVGISPTSRQIAPSETATMTVSFNSGGVPISGIAVRIMYNYAGATPGLTADNIQPIIIRQSGWQCPIQNVSPAGGTVTIDVGCVSTNTAGFSTTSMTELFAFSITAGNTPTTNPIVLMFDPTQTKITKKANGQDTVATPTSTASISIVASNTNATPSPAPSTSPTPTRTPTPTPGSSSFSGQDQDGDLECNQSCTANRDCQADLACLAGQCRSPQCSSDTTCGCQNRNVAGETGETDLPTAGSATLTMVLLGVGLLFILGGAGLLGYYYYENKAVISSN
ncbi:MAG: hypothetical protein ABIJ03_03845 [Patescibacteria group bacterium]|nr:hypothetical protein [Patescibacteria group bacterium]